MNRPQIQHLPPTLNPPPRYHRTTAELSALLNWYTIRPGAAHRMAKMEGLSYLEFQGLIGRAQYVVNESTKPEE
ncbi:MAG: hypothetical protein IPK82_23520 [Polyangiaceae bacterium]|nr:hypothetical protein [Polyangiaceae bacterium]